MIEFFQILQASKKVNLSKWLLLRSCFFTKNLKFDWLIEFVRPHDFKQSKLRFSVKNILLNKSHLERFNTVCTLFPMERNNKCIKTVPSVKTFVFYIWESTKYQYNQNPFETSNLSKNQTFNENIAWHCFPAKFMSTSL